MTTQTLSAVQDMLVVVLSGLNKLSKGQVLGTAAHPVTRDEAIDLFAGMLKEAAKLLSMELEDAR